MKNFIETERLILRQWHPNDLEPFAAINQDPLVMEFFPNTLTKAQTKAMLQRFHAHIEKYGFGLWACTLKETNELIGFVGLNHVNFSAHFTPAVEIGWRLASQHWGKGYATEAAQAALEFGFNHCGLDEIVSFAVPANVRSMRVMEKLGMRYNPADVFYHPHMPKDHALSLHVLYRKTKN